MTALELQTYLANTAHQREVADLQAAGLNPVLSAGSSGAPVPNVMSGGGSNSAKAVAAAARHNPVNKALDLAGDAVSTMEELVSDRLGHTRTPFVETLAPGQYNPQSGMTVDYNIAPYRDATDATLSAVQLLTQLGLRKGSVANTINRVVSKPLARLIDNNRWVNTLASANQLIHDADYARNLLGRK